MSRARVVAATGWLVLGIGLFCLAARSVVSTQHVLVLAAGAAPYAGVLCMLALPAFLWPRRWIGLLVTALLVIALLGQPVRTLLTRPPAVSGATIRLMSFNMRLGQADTTELLRHAESDEVDLLLLQELTRPALTRLRAAGIEKEFLYRDELPAGGASGIGLFSKYPLTDLRTYPDFSHQVLSVRLTLPDAKAMTAFCSHLAAPWPQPASTWKAETEHLGQVLADTPGPVIDAGDFNATTSYRAFRKLLSDGSMVDSATRTGAANLRTYPADRSWLPPLLGIDHVLVRDLPPRSVKTVRIANSDHLALMSVLGMPR